MAIWFYLLLALGIFAYILLSRWIGSSPVTMPILFIGAGLIFGFAAPAEELGSAHQFHLIAEATLALLLFADATMVSKQIWRHTGMIVARLLFIGIPVAVAFGLLANWLILPGWPIWELALLAAILVPTDAALGQSVMDNEGLPASDRNTLLLESGLNDGLALPLIIVFACLAVEGAHEQQINGGPLQFAMTQIGFGVLTGGVVGYVAGLALRAASRWHSIETHISGIAALAVVALVYFGAEALGGNSFIAVFVAGSCFAIGGHETAARLRNFVETDGHLLALLSFLFVGMVLAPEALEGLSWAMVAVVIISLVLVRPLAVYLCLTGTQLQLNQKLFFGWFGPRGLATGLFAVFVLDEFNQLMFGREILHIATIAVLISALAHGVTSHYAKQMFFGGEVKKGPST